MPELVVSRQTKTLREGKVLVDWSQNDAHKTTVNVYSLRARAAPDRLDAADLGRGPRARGAGDGPRRSRPPTSCAASTSTATSSRPVVSLVQALPGS